MGRALRAIVATAAVVLLLTSTPSAHHSPAVFDLRTEITLTWTSTTPVTFWPFLSMSLLQWVKVELEPAPT